MAITDSRDCSPPACPISPRFRCMGTERAVGPWGCALPPEQLGTSSPPEWQNPYLKLNQQLMNISQRQTGQVDKANLLFMPSRTGGKRAMHAHGHQSRTNFPARDWEGLGTKDEHQRERTEWTTGPFFLPVILASSLRPGSPLFPPLRDFGEARVCRLSGSAAGAHPWSPTGKVVTPHNHLRLCCGTEGHHRC